MKVYDGDDHAFDALAVKCIKVFLAMLAVAAAATIALWLVTPARADTLEPRPIAGRDRMVGVAHERRIFEVSYSDGTKLYCYAVPPAKLKDGCTYDPMGQHGALPSPCCKGWRPLR